MPGLTVDAIRPVLKQQYTQNKVNTLVYTNQPTLAMIPKYTKFYGDNMVVALKYGTPQGRSVDFATAQTNITPSKYGRFTIYRKHDYALARISGEAWKASKNDMGALLEGLKGEVDGAFRTCSNNLAKNIFGNGGGSRGTIGAGTTLAGTTILLGNIADVVNFEVGMVLNLASTDGTSGTVAAGSLTVTGVDRDAGTVTVNAAITTIAGVAVGWFIFQAGDFLGTSTNVVGFDGWVPKTTPTSTPFMGLDRSVDVVRLGGIRYVGNGAPIEVTINNVLARLFREGAKTDLITMHPYDFADFVNSLSSKVVYDRMTSPSAPTIGFDVIKVKGPMGDVKVVSDMNEQIGWIHALQLDTWRLNSLEECPGILDLDGPQLLRVVNADEYELRIGHYSELYCNAPGWNAVARL